MIISLSLISAFLTRSSLEANTMLQHSIKVFPSQKPGNSFSAYVLMNRLWFCFCHHTAPLVSRDFAESRRLIFISIFTFTDHNNEISLRLKNVFTNFTFNLDGSLLCRVNGSITQTGSRSC